MLAYSQDLRDRALAAHRRGEGAVSIARRLEVSRLWVWRVVRRAETDGVATALKPGRRRRSVLDPLEAEIRGWIAERPDLTLEEMRARLLAEHGVRTAVSNLWRRLDRWGLTFKKKAFTPASRRRATT